MSQKNKFDSFHEAAENSDDEHAVVDLGFGLGYKVIHQDDW